MTFKIIHYSIGYKQRILKLSTNERERGFLKKLIKDSESKSSTIHILIDADETIIGLVGVSCSKVDHLPALLVDFIFVNPSFRGMLIKDLKCSASEYLIAYITSFIIPHTRTFCAVRWLVLIPDNERLKLHYIEQFGFRTYTDKRGDDLLCLRV
jgi:hypothetical protein